MHAVSAFLSGYLPVYVANGFLATAYWLWDNLALLLSLSCAALTYQYFDALVQRKAHFAGARGTQPRVAQWTTAIVALVWAVASQASRSPVPQIGALMWLGLIGALLVAPQERVSTLWRAKSFIFMYALALLAFRLYLWQTGRLSPEQWAAIVGSSGEARQLVAQNRGMVTSIGLWLLWAIGPLTYFSMLIQKLAVNPISLVSPFKSVAQIVSDLRTRGEGGRAW